MKLQAPQGKTGELHLNGRTFDIDKKGQVEVPDEFVGQSVWQQGYTVVPEPVRTKPVEEASQQPELKPVKEKTNV